MKIKHVTTILCFIIVFFLFSITGYAADISPLDGYEDNDYDKLQAFLNSASLEAGKTNGEYLNPSYDSNDPVTWTGVTWNAVTPKRVVDIDWFEKASLTGSLDVSDFTSLTNLDVSYTRVSSLNTNNCSALADLNCGSCLYITTLDVSTNTALTSLECSINDISALDLTNNTLLTHLGCTANEITTLDVSNQPLLDNLYCKSNQLTSIDVSNNTVLKTMDCSNNDITSIDVSSNSLLETLVCNSNEITVLNTSGSNNLITVNCAYNHLSSVDFSTNTAIEDLNVSGNSLTNLNISANTALITLNCNNNQLSTLNLTPNTALESLNCGRNQLTALDISTNTNLTYLTCSTNQLSSLNLSSNPLLEYLYANSNLLTSLNTTSNPLIKTIYASYNDLTSVNLLGCTLLDDLRLIDNDLTSITLTTNTALQNLDLQDNLLTTLNTSANSLLGGINASNNQLTSLNTTGNNVLTALNVSNNNLASIDLSSNTALTTLNINDNVLTALDTIANLSLTQIYLQNNNLTAYDASSSTGLTILHALGNPLKQIDAVIGGFDLSITALGFGTVGLFYNSFASSLYGEATVQVPYAFFDWTDAATSTQVSTDLIYNMSLGSAHDLNANFTVGVMFDENGGDTPSVPSSYEATIGSLITEPATPPTYAGHSFAGWCIDASGNTEWDFATDTVPGPGNLTLFAKWLGTFTVTFDRNGGETDSVPSSVIAANGTTISEPGTDPTRTGYTFNGWYIDESGNTAWDFANDTVSHDMTLFADWTPIPYNVSFNENGGETMASPSSMIVDFDALIPSQPTPPTWTGYAFDGWYIDASGNTAWDFANDTISGNLILYANWLEEFTVTFDKNEGDIDAVPSSMEVADGSTISPQPTPPTRAGYGFNGWYIDASGNTAWDFVNDTVTSDITLFADWTPTTFLVTFDENGGDTAAIPPTMNVDFGELISPEPTPPTLAGHVFAGWFIDAGGNTEWDFGSDTVSGNLILYADYSPAVTVIFDRNGGDFDSVPSTIQAGIGMTISAPGTEPTRTGYTFNGWFIDVSGNTAWNFATDVVNNNMTLYADWTPIPYNVTFNENQGDTLPVPTSMIVDYDALIPSQPTPPTRAGYVFDGWCTDIAGVFPWDFANDTISGNLTLYAKWLEAFTVTFDRNGGDTDAVPASMSVLDGDTISPQPAPPTRTGHTFNGWYVDDSGNTAWDFVNDTVTSDTTLFADWTPITYLVTFDENGGDTAASPATMNVDYGELISPEPSPPSLSGHVFSGWYIDAGGNTEWDFDNDTVSGNLTLFAIYREQFVVTFDENGGDAPVSPPTMTVLSGDLIDPQPTEPARTGYVFDGWYIDALGNTEWDFANDTVLSSMTLYANWLQVFTVTFDENGGNTAAIPSTLQADIGTTISAPGTEPTRIGYTFNGWYIDASGNTEWDFATDVVNNNLTLFADWTPIPYNVTFNENEGDTLPIPSTMIVNYDALIPSEPTPPTRIGYVFDGWCTDIAGTLPWDFANDTISGNLTLFAKWL